MIEKSYRAENPPRPSLCFSCAENLTVFYISYQVPGVAATLKTPICKPCLDTQISQDLAGKPR